MTGNVAELNDPSNAHGNINVYPNSYFSEAGLDIEPSIRGRKLYIPIEDPFKSSSELLIEVIIQVIIIIVTLFFVHKLVLYVPTYSKMECKKCCKYVFGYEILCFRDEIYVFGVEIYVFLCQNLCFFCDEIYVF